MQFTLKKKINLFDSNFAHARTQLGFDSCGLKEPKNIEWIRDNLIWDGVTVFTDYSCFGENVSKSISKYKIAWLQESPALSPDLYINFYKISHNFNYVFSNVSLPNLPENEKNKLIIFPMAGSWVEPMKEDYQKNKIVSAIFSPKSYLPGHKLRKEIENRFIKDQIIDFYGQEHKFIQNKSEGLYEYFYSVTVENFKANNFFTEKLIDCFLSKTIPIYYGPSNIGEYFNSEGIICFNSVDELEKILKMINYQFYNIRKDIVEENYKIALKYQITDDRFIEELEKRINI